MELLDFRKIENPVTWTSSLTIARSWYEQLRQHIQPHAQDWSHRTTSNIRDKQFQLYNSPVASNLAEIHKQVSKCGDRKTLRFTVYRVKHKKHQTIVHEKEEPLVKQLTAGHTDVIYVNGIELRQRLKPPTPIKSETNNSLLSDRQVCRKTHAAQVNLKMWG